jgi:hypothetical protein
MANTRSHRQEYVLAAVGGAVAGGLLVALATRAIPTIMSRMMSEMMSRMPQKMMARMKEEGINPADM